MKPEMSVVIATQDRRDLVLRCIEALCRQSADPDLFEVVVADDGSTDGTVAALEAAATPFELRVLAGPRAGRSATRNAGIAAARGRVVLFVDDDVVPDRELVAEHLAVHESGGRALVFGHLTQQPPRGRDWYAEAWARSLNRHFAELGSKPVTWIAGYGGNLSVARSQLDQIGGFDEGLVKNEDIELAYRLWRNGAEPRYLPSGTGVHDDQKRRGGLLRDSVRNAEGYMDLVERHPEMLPELLGWFPVGGPRELVLRRILIAMRFPPALLVALGNVVPGSRRQEWFYYVSRYAFWRAARRSMSRDLWVRITHGVPVLMYHAFDPGEAGERYIVSRRAFRAQMRMLRALRYRAISFGELAAAMRGHSPPPRRAVVITVDDGYRDNLEIAQPILRRLGLRATYFLVSGRLGAANDWNADGELAGRPLLSAEEVRRLQADGGEIGAHTRTHQRLSGAGDPKLREEVEGSRRELEAEFGTVATFAYPYGDRDGRAVAAAAEAGFAAAGTTLPRRVRLDDDPMELPRIEIKAGDSLLTFVRKLRLGGA